MKKRIVICADGTWNRPEKNLKQDVATNVLRLARAIQPLDENGVPSQVFYDWGLGSYHSSVSAGLTGAGIEKNTMDGYRYLVQNYSPGDDLYLFGFSRGSYTIRSLAGLINNVGILRRPDARLIQAAFDHYKQAGEAYHPRGEASLSFRADHSHPSMRIRFVGVWDTVGSLGIPFSILGLFEREDEFYDTKIGPNIDVARHALAIDEQRGDFEPTLWLPRAGMDMQQVWFAGAHSDVGGGYARDRSGQRAADDALAWMITEAELEGLVLEPHLRTSVTPSPMAKLHRSRKHIFRSRPSHLRGLDHGHGETLIHKSVRERWEENAKYRPRNLRRYVDEFGWSRLVP